MIETVNTLNELGKCYFDEIMQENGFLTGMELGEKTEIIEWRKDLPISIKIPNVPDAYTYAAAYFPPKGRAFHVKVFRVNIGKDYDEKNSPLGKLPEGTEAVQIYDLEDDGRQAIFYLHRASRDFPFPDGHMKAFKNEFRAQENTVKLKKLKNC